MKEELIKLARQAIKSQLEKKKLKINEKIKKEFSEKRACFVTLTLGRNLRGCIGTLEARQELWEGVITNSINSAFFDTRFFPLTKEEFKKIKIEISILTPAEKTEYKSSDDLKKKISKRGVVIKKGWHSATYLPQVWEQIPNEGDFLSSLCSKAGLPSQTWKKEKMEVWVYDVEKVEENKRR